MVSKQMWLGGVVLVGGMVIVTALAIKPTETPPQAQQVELADDVARPVVEPLTADVNTEARILEQKQKSREAQVQQMEAQTKQLLAAQEAARAEAIKKAQKEQEELAQSKLVVQTRPEAQQLAQEQERQRQEQAKAKAEAQARAEAQAKIQQAQAAQNSSSNTQASQTPTNNPKTHKVQTGDTLIRLSRQYGIPVSILAAANNMGRNDALARGKTLKIPSASEIKALENKAIELEKQEQAKKLQEAQQQNLNQALADARREAKKQGVNESYSVQVALASNQANADIVAKKYKAAGYQVKTVQDARGVRVVVGPERTKEAATLLRDKINSDPNVDSRGAWVLQVK